MINQRLQADLLRLATRDPLTGCLNRRAMTERLEGELLRFRRYDRKFSMVLLDLDRFKVINDRWGHAAGDEVLSKVAQVLHGALRGGDSLSRWGGEEFLVCLPETPLVEAARLADRLRDLVADQTFGFADVSVTFSGGVAEVGPGESIDALCRRADQALYRAKETRNRTVMADADPPS
jgi:diguanylate cyclase (GGDEF)-like protein